MSYLPLHNEKDLINRVAEGDEEAFALIYQHYYSQLRPYLWKFTSSPTHTDEILQETFIRVWLSRDKLPEIENFRAWIYKVASREALTYLRLQLQHVPDMLDEEHASSPEITTPLEIFHVTQVNQLIKEAIEIMPAQRKLIFQLHRGEGLKVGQIAEKLGLSVSTVKNTVATAQRQIREHLTNAGFEFPIFILVLLSLV